MLSWLKALWSGAPKATAQPALAAVEYKGFRIQPTPFASRGQFQTAGVIEKEFETGVKRHEFIRADTLPNEEDAAAHAISKAKQIIDQQGDGLFMPQKARSGEQAGKQDDQHGT
jgi:hypothetical protein